MFLIVTLAGCASEESAAFPAGVRCGDRDLPTDCTDRDGWIIRYPSGSIALSTCNDGMVVGLYPDGRFAFYGKDGQALACWPDGTLAYVLRTTAQQAQRCWPEGKSGSDCGSSSLQCEDLFKRSGPHTALSSADSALDICLPSAFMAAFMKRVGNIILE